MFNSTIIGNFAISEYFRDWDRPEGPGGMVAVQRGDEYLYRSEHGRANLSNPQPWHEHSRFRILGCTQSFVGALLLQCEDKGRIALDDPVRKWLPEMAHVTSELTVRHLANHTSGVRNNELLQFLSGIPQAAPLSFSYVMEVICRQQELDFAPGSRMSYSDADYRLLGEILSRAWDTDLVELIDRQICRPLGLENTQLVPFDGPVTPNMVTGYTATRTGEFRSFSYLSSVTGDGGVVSSLADMLIWCRALKDNALGIERWYTRLTSNPPLPNGQKSGYGIGIVQQQIGQYEVLSARGSFPGFASHFAIVPELDIVAVALANFDDDFLSARFSAMMNTVIGEQGDTKRPASTRHHFKRAAIQRRAGWYANRESGKVICVKAAKRPDWAELEDDIETSAVRGPLRRRDDGRYYPLWPYSSACIEFVSNSKDEEDLLIEVGAAELVRFVPTGSVFIPPEEARVLVGLYGCAQLNAIHRIYESEGRLWHMRGAGEWPEEQVREIQKVAEGLYVLDYPSRYFTSIQLLTDSGDEDAITSYRVSVRGAENIVFRKLPDPLTDAIGSVDRLKLLTEPTRAAGGIWKS